MTKSKLAAVLLLHGEGAEQRVRWVSFPGECVCLFYPPVVLRLKKLELLLDAVQRLRDGELEGLAWSLVGRLTHARMHGERRGVVGAGRGDKLQPS